MRWTEGWTDEYRLQRIGWFVTNDGCWEWGGTRNKQGYGGLCVKHKVLRAHRFAYETWVGPIPEGQVVRHKCDNPPCVNPNHLETGTHSDNAQDRERRGRGAPRYGEFSTSAKLTEQDVLDIRTEYGYGVLTQQMLADVYGVSRNAVTDILSGKNWSHLTTLANRASMTIEEATT